MKNVREELNKELDKFNLKFGQVESLRKDGVSEGSLVTLLNEVDDIKIEISNYQNLLRDGIEEIE